MRGVCVPCSPLPVEGVVGGAVEAHVSVRCGMCRKGQGSVRYERGTWAKIVTKQRAELEIKP